MEQFIDLNRKFYPLPAEYSHAAKSDDVDISEAFGFQIEATLHWNKLLIEYRVIILAEAGAGKTQEIRHATEILRSQGKPAFFLRLEHITSGLETAFEIGKHQEFQEWLNSDAEGWLLLDSVDEARLRDPIDFERAIRYLANRISGAIPRTHIIITSRSTAWRYRTDINLCTAQFPPVDNRETGNETNLDVSMSETSSAEAHSDLIKTHSNSDTELESTKFKIFSLVNLDKEQIGTFIKARGINDSERFLIDVERQEGWAFMTRPQDLEELIGFWKAQHRIGTRFEMMEYSVERRLKERDQNRAELKPFTLEKAQKGVRLLAAACVLTNESIIRVPDGANYAKGIYVKSVLTDWNDSECQILLNLPIFDEAIYGAVRFHHRSVREFLTAQWFSEELKNEGSRQRIESIFFRTQYERVVVIPSMKPILSWLVLFDRRIMINVYKLEPEIILQGGDPGKLPLENRREILTSVCQKIASGNSDKSIERYAAVQRFALPDMADDIIGLMDQYKTSRDVANYLLNLIWQGRIKKALPIAKNFALDRETEQYNRFTALKTLKELGSKEDLDAVLEAFLSEEKPHNRSFFSELINGLEAVKASIELIVKGLENIEGKSLYGHDSLGYALADFIKRADAETVVLFIKEIDKFLHHKPVYERRYCEISQQYGWLLPVSKEAIVKLILLKHPGAFSSESLFALTQIPVFKEYHDFDGMEEPRDITAFIADWRELNYALFWKAVEETRKHLDKKRDEPLNNFWRVYNSEKYWSFSKIDFERILADISGRPLLDDQLIALTLAFQLYRDNERPRKWLPALKKAVADNNDLTQRLAELLNPPAQNEEIRRWKQNEAMWQRRNKERETKHKEENAKGIKWLKENYQTLRSNGLDKGHVSQNQYYVYDRMRRLDGDTLTKWTDGNWQGLIKDYGIEVATAFRDGAVSFWRGYTPTLRSERDEKNETPLAVLFGLTGLEIESRERLDWLQDMSKEEAELVCRYAFHELNGFPNWFPKLFKKFPEIVYELTINEIVWELETQIKDPNGTRHYVLSRVSWDCEWLWDGIAPKLMHALEKEPIQAKDLGEVLKIIERSSTVSDKDLSTLAERKCSTISSWDNLACWFATWIGIVPEYAIQSFSSCLDTFHTQDREKATNLAMRTIVNLVGKRHGGSHAIEAFKIPQHLKDLYFLMHRYIRAEDDIDRSNKGAYSPGLRDDAQEARNSLYSILKSLPGKESYMAMIELSQTHPVERYRNWMLHDAKERAEMDADSSVWTVDKFNEFSKTLESTPANHRELFDLAVQRLLDMKHDLEESDESIASTLVKEDQETGIRKVIAGWCNDRAKDRYRVTQEEELPDAKRPDCRFLSSLFDAPVPVELKLADNWSGPFLFERLENQLCGDYLRDRQSNRGIFILVYRGSGLCWQIPNGNPKANFPELIEALQNHWNSISSNYPKIEQIKVIGIDLTKRVDRVKRKSNKLKQN